MLTLWAAGTKSGGRVMSTRQPEVLYEFEKRRATVRAYVTDFRGKRYAHIREFVEPEPGAELVATRAGVCVELDDLEELQRCVDALAGAVGKRLARAGS